MPDVRRVPPGADDPSVMMFLSVRPRGRVLQRFQVKLRFRSRAIAQRLIQSGPLRGNVHEPVVVVDPLETDGNQCVALKERISMDFDDPFLIVLFTEVAGECFLRRFKSQIRRLPERSREDDRTQRRRRSYRRLGGAARGQEQNP